MSRTFRRYIDTYYRNAHHCKRLVSEKSRHNGEMTAGAEYDDLEARLANKLSINGRKIPYQFVDFNEFHFSSTGEIHIPSPESIRDIRLTARRFMHEHKCSYCIFVRAVYGRRGFYNRNVLPEEAVLFEIKSF